MEKWWAEGGPAQEMPGRRCARLVRNSQRQPDPRGAENKMIGVMGRSDITGRTSSDRLCVRHGDGSAFAFRFR